MLSASSSYLYETGSRMQPVYLMHFDGKSTDYVTRDRINNTTYTVKDYMQNPRGNAQKITPEEGKSSIGQLTIPLLDKDEEIMVLIGGDSANLHRVKTTIKAGYVGMDEADMLTAFTGWVTDIKMWDDMLGYDFVITDPQRYFQKKLFRYATNSAPVYLAGNPINILLGLLTSTGSGTNGSYDWYDAENGIGLDESAINVSNIETQRDHWLPGERWSMTITNPIVAKRFLEDEFFAICNIYPIVKGDGTFDIRVYHGPIPSEDWQGFDEGVIIGQPRWDQNLSEMVNEVQVKYDHDATNDEYDTEEWHIDAESFAARGPGKRALKLESKGIRTSLAGSAFITRRAEKVFDRYAVPPPKLRLKTFFSRHLSEVGDIVPVSHTKIPNLNTGSRGVSSHWMEVINRTPRWNKGYCDFELLHTGWDQKYFMEISPSMRVTSGVNEYQFVVESGDGSHYDVGYRIDLIDFHARSKAADIAVNSIVGDVITVTSLGVTPTSGDLITFASSYGNLADLQTKFWAIDSLYQILA